MTRAQLASLLLFFFFNDPPTTEIYTLSLHDALPICRSSALAVNPAAIHRPVHAGDTIMATIPGAFAGSAKPSRKSFGNKRRSEEHTSDSSHSQISYAVFCLKKKNKHNSMLLKACRHH